MQCNSKIIFAFLIDMETFSISSKLNLYYNVRQDLDLPGFLP